MKNKEKNIDSETLDGRERLRRVCVVVLSVVSLLTGRIRVLFQSQGNRFDS